MPEPEKLWGLKFNPSPSYERLKRDQRPQGSPEWLNPHQISLWQEQGLIVWNSAEKRMGRLSGQEALALLGKLVSQINWKAEGISITKQVHKIHTQVPPRGRRKKTEPETTAVISEKSPGKPGGLRLDPEIHAVPLDKAADPVLQGRPRSVVEIPDQIVDGGIGRRDITGLHRQDQWPDHNGSWWFEVAACL